MKNISLQMALLLALLISLVSCQPSAISTDAKSDIETSILQELNIPTDADRVIIFSHNAHMDWDWLNTFPYNVDKSPPVFNSCYFPCGWCGNTSCHTYPADSILSLATEKLVEDSAYYYSVCEMGFLRAFAENKPQKFAQMKASNRMRIVGGGITSPDNLLPHGEAFFRNFLVAKQWLDDNSVPWTQQVWLPDDFGHDPQLPVMLQGLDAMGVSFARIPGACDSDHQYFSEPQSILLDSVNGGVDFWWKAADGSLAIAHWLQDHYGQGSDIDEKDSVYNSLDANLTCKKDALAINPGQHIKAYLNTNGPVSPSPYIFVDVSGDFMVPYQKLIADVNQWNDPNNQTPNGYNATGVYAVVATFDHYVRLISNYSSNLKTRSYHSSATPDIFQPNPYWMGYYASRPELKLKHNSATRSLLAAEAYQLIANTLVSSSMANKQSQMADLLSAWDSLAPSTHHDYITGTAVDNVYSYEQLRMLRNADSLGNGLKQQFMTQVAKELTVTEESVVVFNSLGYDNEGIIAYQNNSGQNLLLNVKAPSLGYEVNNLAEAQQGDNSLTFAINSDGNYIFSNDSLIAGFDPSNANLLFLTDIKGQKNVLAPNEIGNEIVIFNDNGGIYRFGYETNDPFSDTQVTWKNIKVSLDTSNTLQKSINVVKTANLSGNPEFTITYSLRQGEPYLRISTKGTLPYYYTAMVKFPLADAIDNIQAGTPYHWNSMTPMKYGGTEPFNPTVWATHDFVIPSAGENALAAIYHGSTPAWTSIDNDLYGVILRNTPTNAYGAYGSDTGVHQQEYALRIPSGLGDPENGQPLREARQYNSPMEAIAIEVTGGETASEVPETYSLAATTGNAMITAAKWCYTDPNALILRVYQPSNSTVQSTLTVDADVNSCGPVSALEIPITVAKVVANCEKADSDYHLTLPRAVSTFKLEFE